MVTTPGLHTPVNNAFVLPDGNTSATLMLSPGAGQFAADAPATVAAKPDRDINDIRAAVAGNRDAFRACYDRSLKAHPGIKGTFVLKFVVNPEGSVKSAEAAPLFAATGLDR